MREINRRVVSNAKSGMSIGPISVYAVDAELVVEDEGNTVYLHAQWMNAEKDTILFEATTESVYDAQKEIEKIITGESKMSFQDAIIKRDFIQREKDAGKLFGGIDIKERYSEQYDQLLQMMQEVIDQDGVGVKII